jgi:hypothetical protein
MLNFVIFAKTILKINQLKIKSPINEGYSFFLDILDTMLFTL